MHFDLTNNMLYRLPCTFEDCFTQVVMHPMCINILIVVYLSHACMHTLYLGMTVGNKIFYTCLQRSATDIASYTIHVFFKYSCMFDHSYMCGTIITVISCKYNLMAIIDNPTRSSMTWHNNRRTA